MFILFIDFSLIRKVCGGVVVDGSGLDFWVNLS